MCSNTLVFLRARGKLASFFWVSLEHWTDLHKMFKMHLTLLHYSCIFSFLSFFPLWASLPPSSPGSPQVSWYFLVPWLFTSSLLTLFTYLVSSYWLSSSGNHHFPLVSASVGGDCFVRSLGGNNKVQSKESGLQANSVTEVAVHEGYYMFK